MKKPQDILARLIIDVGIMSDGWAVDILVAAIEYLDSRTPQEYLEKRAYTVAGIKMVRSTVDCWVRGMNRGIPMQPKDTIQ
jgi:hypothetical protein